MSKSNSPAKAPGLAAATYGFVATTLMVIGVIAALVFWSRSDQLLGEALDTAVRVRTEAAGEVLARTIHGDWRDLQVVATRAAEAPLTLRPVLDGMRGDGTRVSWAGVADTAGRVVAASGGLLDGADVSERPWFRQGLRGGFAGDVHDAVLLAQLLGADGAEPLRFIDLALPVRDTAGEIIGVAAVHIDAAWLRETLRETGEMLEVDLFLIGADGIVVAGPSDAGEPTLLAAARAGAAMEGRAEWPDGGTYFASLVPEVGYADLPSFGWRLAGRIRADAFRPGMAALATGASITALIALALLAGLTALFVAIYVRPLGHLARAAERMAEGAEDYPPELGSTREAATLSAALARLQALRTGG